MGEKIYWLSGVPGFCEVCDGPIHGAFYDSRTRQGPWALVCEKCFQRENGKIGPGFAQKYVEHKDGKWWKS